MIWHIVKREIYDNFNSLRFSLTTVSLLALMCTNAIVHLREYPQNVQKYNDAATESHNALTARPDLYEIARKGPGNLYKKPADLRFCADGGDALLPDVVRSDYYRWSFGNLTSFWVLNYTTSTPNVRNIRPDGTRVDWGFIIGYALSLVAILFTFDSISGERERGTLRLILANSIPRHTLLFSKFLGALITISIPFVLAVLINLMMISTSNEVHFTAKEWERLSIIFFITLLYTSLFLALGLLVSARLHRSSVSLIILLLVWITFVSFIPSTLASIASGFSSSMSTDELRKRQNQLYQQHSDDYDTRIQDTLPFSLKRMQLKSEFVIKDVADQERLRQEHLNQQILQVQHARAINRISPAAILQHLLEVFAGTGWKRHLQFLENVQRYARHYREFVMDTDRTDPESLHLIGVREGMSKQNVSPAAIPIFEDTLSLRKDFNSAAMELLVLIMFLVVFLVGAYLALVRSEI